eukprot:204014_1
MGLEKKEVEPTSKAKSSDSKATSATKVEEEVDKKTKAYNALKDAYKNYKDVSKPDDPSDVKKKLNTNRKRKAPNDSDDSKEETANGQPPKRSVQKL